jgi:hypothetical protein
LPAVTLTGEQVAAGRDREPASGQPGLGIDAVVEGRDRADRKQDDRIMTRITGRGDAHIAGDKTVAGQVVGAEVVIDRFVSAELSVGRELEVDPVSRRDGCFLRCVVNRARPPPISVTDRSRRWHIRLLPPIRAQPWQWIHAES